MDRAETVGVDPEQSYENLRERIEILTCKWCGDEHLGGYSEKFCTDACEVNHINEYYR